MSEKNLIAMRDAILAMTFREMVRLSESLQLLIINEGGAMVDENKLSTALITWAENVELEEEAA
ncbi:hypothetical protein [Sneathiella glossodoripedis]|uniref:hypothetical protein n=1 Tax=Sneathiella glossodoripedis TaxID=418853 RepID=UPI00046EC40D|nr:hypothetical protein [Sneathiella glossodoripedis]